MNAVNHPDPKTRDVTLDILKGIACIGMVLAHLIIFDPNQSWAVDIQFFAGLATGLFFSIAGINVLPQVHKYGLRYLFALNAALFIFGTAYSYLIHPDLYQRYLLEIFQIIALGGLAVALIEYYLRPGAWVYGLLGLFVYLIKLAINHWLPEVDGAGILLTHADYVPHHRLVPGEGKMWPGFPLLPWLYVFFMGPFLYKQSQGQLLSLSLILCVGFAYLLTVGLLPQWREKWDMTPGYFLLSLLSLSTVMLVVRQIPASWLSRRHFVLFLGANSLAFLFIHGFGLLLAIALKPLGQIAGWAIVLAVTWLGLKLMQRWKGFALMSRSTSWVILALVVLLLPLLALHVPASQPLAMLLELISGIVFAKHLPQLRHLLLRRFVQG